MPQKTIKNEFQQIDASTAEEIDALEVNLRQGRYDIRDTRHGTGLIEDDVARDQIEGMTEAGADLVDKGVDDVAPGRDGTSTTLRQHRPTSQIVRVEDQLEANLDEPRDEAFFDR
jgi:hypothetical protein